MKEWIAANPGAAVDLLVALLGALGLGTTALIALVKYAKVARAVATTLVDALERGKTVGSPAVSVIARIAETEMPKSREELLTDIVAEVKGRPRKGMGKRIAKLTGRALLGGFLRRLK